MGKLINQLDSPTKWRFKVQPIQLVKFYIKARKNVNSLSRFFGAYLAYF